MKSNTACMAATEIFFAERRLGFMVRQLHMYVQASILVDMLWRLYAGVAHKPLVSLQRGRASSKQQTEVMTRRGIQ
jgi:hypothetical protein